MHNNRYDHIDLLECMDIRWSMFNYRPTTGNKAARFIQMISCNTLGIYFLHVIILYPTLVYIRRTPLFCNIGMNMIYAFGIMCASVLLVLIIKKIPWIRGLLQVI